jgi:hypothetical protein
MYQQRDTLYSQRKKKFWEKKKESFSPKHILLRPLKGERRNRTKRSVKSDGKRIVFKGSSIPLLIIGLTSPKIIPEE